MGSEVCADEQVIMCGNLKLISKVVDEEEAGPATPDENAEHNHNHNHHDFSSSSPSPPLCCNHNGLETPKDTLFDSFAPASDKFLLAPHHRKYREELRNLVVRRLDFTKDLSSAWSSDEENEEERLFQIVYGTIMGAILAEQGKEEETAAGSGGRGTPKSAPFLNGIAETCPAAPIKSGRKHRFIDKEICKKLEF